MHTAILIVGLFAVGVGALMGEGLLLGGASLLLLRGLWHSAASRSYILYGPEILLLITFVLGGLLSSFGWAQEPLATGAPWSAAYIVLFPVIAVAWQELEHQWRQRLLCTMLAIATLSAGFAIVQHYVLLDYSEWLTHILPTYRMKELAPTSGYKVGGLHFHRLKFANTLVVLGLAAGPQLAQNRAAKGRMLLLILAPVFLFALLLTYTHATWGALVVGATLLFLSTTWSRAARKWAAMACVLGAALVPMVLAVVGAPWPKDRVFAWQTALALFKNAPWFGVGHGGYPAAALELMGGAHPTYPLLHFDAHALFLQVLSERGLVGMALFVGLLVAYQRCFGPINRAQLAVIGAASVLSMVHNLAYHVVSFGALALALAITTERRRSVEPHIAAQDTLRLP